MPEDPAAPSNPLPREAISAEPVAAPTEPVEAESVAGEVVPSVPIAAEPVGSGPVGAPDPGYSASGVPTFDSVREKIETRYGTSLGAAELDAESPEGRSVEEQYDARQRAAAQRLDQIRESMRTEQGRSDT